MAESFSRRHFQDTSRINLHQDWELRFWSDKWNVSRPELMDAVKRVGVQVRDVARALGKACGPPDYRSVSLSSMRRLRE
jgi:hypothetical protein